MFSNNQLAFSADRWLDSKDFSVGATTASLAKNATQTWRAAARLSRQAVADLSKLSGQSPKWMHHLERTYEVYFDFVRYARGSKDHREFIDDLISPVVSVM